MVSATEALPGRSTPLRVTRPHLVYGTPLEGPFAEGTAVAYVALGCFWGAERKFFETTGVVSTAVGYQGGFTPNPTYEEVCSGRTGHAEAVRVVYDPALVSYESLLGVFFESHNPTQGYRQGNDIGTQYRSAIYTVDADQAEVARAVAERYHARLLESGYPELTTEIAPAGEFYLAEEYHQQYLVANPNGYCGLGGTGVSCPVGVL
ncbi:MAG: peptide-methionine (S)-S-oxide reductase MsrA [Acidimicrobiaceae bacterium]|nr:peptide-methionine (S)-S-oxide reductase MsrA [Acidimicrobiaceae bacterium]